MWKEAWERYKGRIIGVAGGIFLGIVYLIRGFWDMLIVAFILCICYLLGKKADEKQEWPSVVELWQWLMDRWRMFR